MAPAPLNLQWFWPGRRSHGTSTDRKRRLQTSTAPPFPPSPERKTAKMAPAPLNLQWFWNESATSQQVKPDYTFLY